MKLLLIEDDPIWRTEILMQLDGLNYKNISICNTLDEAVELLNTTIFDVIISDVLLKEISIFNLFNLNSSYAELPFIFMTVAEQTEYYALSKQVKNSLYLIKPFHQLTLQSAIESLMLKEPNHEVQTNGGIKVRGKYGEFLFLNSSQIIFIKSELAYCKIKTANNQFVVKNNMKNLCHELGPDILQIHRTYAVNTRMISKVDLKSKLIHTQFGQLPIGRAYKNSLVKHLSAIQTI